MNHKRRFLAHAGIAALTGLGGIVGASHSAPALIGASSRFRRFEGDDKEPTVEELKAQLAAANDNANRYKGDLDKVTGERDAHKTELDKITDASKTAEQRQADERKAEIDRITGETTAEREKREAVEAKLAKRDALDALKGANVIDPELAYSAIKDAIEMKDGEPTNIAKLVEKFVADRPAMVGKTPPDTRPSNPSTQGGGGNDQRPSRPAGRI